MKIKFKIHIVIIAGLFTLNACCSKEDLAGNDIGKFIVLVIIYFLDHLKA